MAFGITQGIQLATGLAGLFGGKKKDPLADLKKQYLQGYLGRQQDIYNRAQAYDPMKETRSAVDFAQKSTGRALENATLGINQRFKNAGGSPTGDTNFSLGVQRQADDILNPLAQFAAERASSTWQMKQAALQAAMGAPPGQIADAYEATRSAPNPYPANSQGMVIGALDQIFNPPTAKKPSVGSAARSRAGKKSLPNWNLDPTGINSYLS